ncbi:hypothetical protein JG688_00000402 [Phytophthora aleatoria]|uniref:Uncharacterized protein n=1 Tax=Phytophthora aleatoria TaxID=2496075 RepID=A0A8J5J533_9STRA|nr:hypothetical protein JG688_00000402 [Phytophthora aleatoria]
MKADADAADKLLVEGVEALEKYLDDHEVANAKLKQAKLRLPEHAMTEISYHEEFEASRVATLDSEGNWRLQDAPETKVQAKSGGDSLRHRRAGTVEEPRSSNAGGNTSTLLWFSSLPPSDLRQAQKQFSNGTLIV